MHEGLCERLALALGGRPVAELEQVGGGDVSRAYRATLVDGERVFVKTLDGAPPELFAREAAGLRWLAEPGVIAVPEVLAAQPELLALRWVEAGPRGRRFDERFGAGLAALHRSGAPHFGLAHDNFIGPLRQPNRSHASFAAFYTHERLAPLLAAARARGLASAALMRRFEALYARLPALLASDEPPARLHGDLWSGNVLCDAQGEPVLIDPAVYGGEREVDLAMLQLFGRPSARFFDAYDAVYPRRPGAAERAALLQLYPLLVHVLLFGGGYVAQLTDALSRYA